MLNNSVKIIRLTFQSSIASRGKFAALAAAVVLMLLGLSKSFASGGAVINAASMSRADVGAAVAAAQDGDTVLVPAGVADWTNYLYVTNAITLQFAGLGQSIIMDDIAYVNGGNPSYTEACIAFQPVHSNYITRLSGVQIIQGTNGRSPTLFEKGCVQVLGATGNIRIDHCLFTNINDTIIWVWNGACPVIDHCSFFETNVNTHAIAVEADQWAGGSYGDGSFSTPAVLGTSNAVYIENCFFVGPGPGSTWALIDTFEGARWVFRYNSIINGWLSAHGTESTSLYRGTRSWEVYMNTGYDSNELYLTEFRSGTGVIWSNTVTGFQTLSRLDDYRSSGSFNYWGGVTGTNFMDCNDPANAKGRALVAVHAGTNGSPTLVVTNNFTASQYIGYTIIDTNMPTAFMGPTTNQTQLSVTNFGEINGSSGYVGGYTTFRILPGPSTSMTFNRGDVIVFYKPCICALDMSGTGLCGPLNRVTSGPNAGNPLGPWPTNTVEPVYGWGNTLNGSDSPVYSVNAIIVSNVHYFNDIPKPGYVPFSYPHPLTLSTAVAVLTPPTGLRIVSEQ
jgi:hypothetical protein